MAAGVTAQRGPSADCTVIQIFGRFDFAKYREFRSAIEQFPAHSFVVDMAAVDYMDSAALGMLLLLRELVGDDPHRLRLINHHGQPEQVLGIARFGQLMDLG